MRTPPNRRVRPSSRHTIVFLLLAIAPLALQSQTSAPPSPKSENAAVAISVGSTAGLLGLAAIRPRGALPVALVFTGLFIGPSTGYWYADSPR